MQQFLLLIRCNREDAYCLLYVTIHPYAVSSPSAGEREDAAMGEGQHQPHRPGPHHLHRYTCDPQIQHASFVFNWTWIAQAQRLLEPCSCRDGLLHRGRQEDPVAGEAALVWGSARAPQEHLLPRNRPPAPSFLQAMRQLWSSSSVLGTSTTCRRPVDDVWINYQSQLLAH